MRSIVPLELVNDLSSIVCCCSSPTGLKKSPLSLWQQVLLARLRHQRAGDGCDSVCVYRGGSREEGHLATSPMSEVHCLAWCVVAHCLLFYQGRVSVYRPGKVIGGTLYKWKGAGWSRQRCWWHRPTLFFLPSVALNRSDKSPVSITQSNPMCWCTHTFQTHSTPNIQPRQMYTGCILTCTDRLEFHEAAISFS